MPPLEDLIALSAELHAQGRDRVERVVARLAQEEEPALLGGEEEHEPHHHSEPGFVELLRLHIAEQLAVAVLVCAVERLHQYLDGAPDLIAERVGNFVLVL